MKFKKDAIKPGMVIHCPKEEDTRALLEHLDSLGYCWANGNSLSGERSINFNIKGYYFPEFGKKVTIGIEDDAKSEATEITEFSDLIESNDSPMTAVEVLQWLMKYHSKMEFKECFGQLYAMDILFRLFTAEEILNKITAYEAAKKEKPVEVEFGWRIEVYEENGDLWNGDSFWLGYTREEVESIAKRVAIDCVRQTGKLATWSVIDACKVKED